jgi:FKBP-type peptidyl-prolyl cis-trans isomerase 2
MATAKKGDTVKVHYKGTLEDGTEFDSSLDRDPLQFTVGAGKLILAFEQAVVGMSPGESKTLKISAADAYGPHREDLVMTVDRGELPEDLDPEVGDELELEHEEESFVVRVTDVSEESATLDANHPLAGEALIFDIELLEVV